MDQMDVKVSVIMLTHNREELVTHAIESVLAQTMREFEFIIVDNGSRDRSGIIADQYAEKDNRIRVLHWGRAKRRTQYCNGRIYYFFR